MFEHVLNNESSFQLSGSYLGKSFYLNLIEASASDPIRYVVKGYRFQTEYKYYISTLLQHKKAPEGLYIAPAYSFSRAKITSRYYNASDKYISLTYSNYCLKIGYQFVNNTLVFDTFIGAGYRDNIWVDYINNPGTVIDEKEYTIYPGHLKLLIGFNIGYAF
jgi:hypothetical protein